MVGQNGRMGPYLEAFVTTVLRFRLPVLVGILLCTTLLGWQLRHLKFDTSNEGFLHEDDPYLKTYNQFREEFGRDDFLVLAVYSEQLFSSEALDKLRALHEDLLGSVPFLEDITSLINVRDVRGEDDTLLVDERLIQFSLLIYVEGFCCLEPLQHDEVGIVDEREVLVLNGDVGE